MKTEGVITFIIIIIIINAKWWVRIVQILRLIYFNTFIKNEYLTFLNDIWHNLIKVWKSRKCLMDIFESSYFFKYDLY